MCLIFVRDLDGGRLDWATLEKAYHRNNDGAGLLWWSLGKWHTEKNVKWPWDDLRAAIRDLDRQSEAWAVHFRLATKGVIDERNCHPFSLGSGGYLMHNGTVHVPMPWKERSDSWHLARAVRRGEKSMAWLVKQSVGSRLLIAEPDGELIRIGTWFRRSAGWFSNDRSFQRREAREHCKAPAWLSSVSGGLRCD